MENLACVKQLITKKVLLEHLSVIIIFSVLTVIFTFPVILDFTSEPAGLDCYDKCHMMWRFWWTNFSFENGLDFQHSNYIFYPGGADIGGNVAYFTTYIGSLLVQFLDYTTTWNVIWFSGLVFGGYGCYLLANNFNRNYLSSIIAGIIFTFTTYHMAHSMTHIGLSMIVWIPILALFLFKLLEKQSKSYAIVGGIIFFLVSLTHLYYSVFVIMFSIVFFAIYIFRQKKVSNKTFITNFSILFTIGLISTSVLFFSNPTLFTEESEVSNVVAETVDEYARSVQEHLLFSNSLENLILPTPDHTTQMFSDYLLFDSFYSFFGKSIHGLQIEQYAFLGYSVIFLSALAVIKYRQNHIWFWLLICGIFIVMSFGPELKILHEPTGIVMPDKIFYDAIPGWDELRAPARFIVMANLSLAMLASFAVYGLMKSRFSSFKQQLVLASIIGFVILFEFSMIPYPAEVEPIPDIYKEIKNDGSKFAVLAVPIGGTGDYMLMSDPTILYHQIYHEKPIIGGYESRVSYETMSESRTYFLNMFHGLGTSVDIVKQDISIHGLALFDYFDIKYVTLHKNLLTLYGLTLMKQTMSEILNEDTPIHEDDNISVYKIPKPNSLEPFLLLGSGWHTYEECEPDEKGINCYARVTMENSEILIINPTESTINTTLEIVLKSILDEKTLTISFNNEKLNVLDVPITHTVLHIENLILVPGVNVVTLHTDEVSPYQGTEQKRAFQKEIQIGIIVESLSIVK